MGRTLSLDPRRRHTLVGLALLVLFATLAPLADAVWSQCRTQRMLAVSQGMSHLGPPPLRAALLRADAEDLSEHLARERAHGLRYLARVDRRGAVLAEAGDAEGHAPGADWGELPPMRPLDLGERTRILLIPHGLPPELATPPRSARMVVEFVPRVSLRTLLSPLGRALGVGLLGVVGLVGVLELTRRSWLRARDAEADLERQRHLATLGEMSAVLAHEIRNPLASLKGHAQLLAEATTPGDRTHDKAQRIVGEAQRLETLVHDLLAFARTREPQRTETDLPALLARTVASGPDHPVDLDTTGAPRTWPLDAAAVRRALLNLLDNAHAHSPPEAPIRLTARADGPHLVLEVTDQGEGLPPDTDPDRLFEPFETHRTQGTGLGLAVVRRVAQQHGGTATAGPGPDGVGARFTLTLGPS